MEFRTDKERERDTRNKAICAEYTKQRNANPDISRNRIINAIAQKNALSTQAVRVILQSAGLYN